ncbi:ATP-binding protein [Actinacidiphila rubida]|uniref:histidine kinase n=1 Tax=Actinacidiphila rubida TaxID=310780 RepID=A0A1H8MV78_9ACTN|nr:ATP-binding protein [Actinacidiphila rubida]SEO21272.1 Signal transduction histidine kinase [Actinacidiphila rubida]
MSSANVFLGTLAVVFLAAAVVIWIQGRNRARVIAGQAQQLRKAQADYGSLAEENARQEQERQRMLQDRELAMAQASADAESRTMAIMKAWAATLQSLAVRSQTELEGIQQKYGGHPVLPDLLNVNHAITQTLRRLQTISVACGGSLGRRRQAASVYDVVRSALSTLRQYGRVKIMDQSPFALRAPVIPAVSLAIAEILHNATDYSPPHTDVTVQFMNVHNGLCVVIDDAGIGMNEEEKRRAAALLSGEFVPTISQLGNPPRIGFAVMGMLASQFGFQVDVLGRSAYGGVRAVVLLPNELLTEEPIEPQMPQTTQGPGQDQGQDQGAVHIQAATAHGLPRRAVRTLETGLDESSAPPAAQAPNDRQTLARRLSGLQQGTREGRVLSVSTEGDETH